MNQHIKGRLSGLEAKKSDGIEEIEVCRVIVERGSNGPIEVERIHRGMARNGVEKADD